jgi:hypothetical protein
VEVNALIVESGTVDSKCETSTAADKSGGEKNAAEKMVKMGIGSLFAAVVGAAVMVV